MNSELLQRYENEMREKRRQQEQFADRESAEWDRIRLLREVERLRKVNGVLLAACKAAQLALRATFQREKDYTPELTMLREAIAKAEGR